MGSSGKGGGATGTGTRSAPPAEALTVAGGGTMVPGAAASPVTVSATDSLVSI